MYESKLRNRLEVFPQKLEIRIWTGFSWKLEYSDYFKWKFRTLVTFKNWYIFKKKSNFWTINVVLSWIFLRILSES